MHKDFFVKLGAVPKGLKKVKTLRDDWTSEGIYIATFQKLSMFESEDLDRLADDFDLVIVDEGHSEPAPVWSKISRRFEKHRVVITATPYRNDLFQFDVDPIHNYAYSFKQAVQDRVVTAPEFRQIRIEESTELTKDFIQRNAGSRCVVKCKTFDDVKFHLRGFEREGLRAIAIHERFSGENLPNSYSRVPSNLRELEWDVVVHQHMIDEGVDIPEAKALVLTYPVASGRELVQAVGRVVRPDNNITPIVLDCSGHANETLWRNYLAFDDYISSRKNWDKFIRSLDTSSLLKAYLEAFPDIGYFGNSYRAKFDIATFDPVNDLKIPLASLCFLGVGENFSLSSFCDSVYWQFHKAGELVRLIPDQAGFEVIVSVRFDSSRYLRQHLFFQPTLEVLLIARVANDLVAIFDSRSVNYANNVELGTRSPVSVGALLQLASRSGRVRTKEAHAVSVGQTRHRAERFSLTGSNLEDVNAGQRNSGYALSTLRVDNLSDQDDRVSSYYLGMGSGRVSDQKLRNFTLYRLQEWLIDIGEALAENRRVRSELLASFAQPTHVTPDSAPVAVVIDLSQFQSDFELTVGGATVSLSPSFIFLKAVGDHLVGEGLVLRANFDEESGRLKFSSEVPVTTAEDEDFVELINRAPVRALYDGAISYFDGNFYRVTLPSERGIAIENTKLGGSLVAVAELQKANLTEKGRTKNRKYFRTTASSFDGDSVFWLIDQIYRPTTGAESDGLLEMRNQIAGCDLVLCCDMGTEFADFVFSSSSKVCFVHIKCGSSSAPRSPAGAIAQVGSQAIKNLEHLISKNADLGPVNAALLAQAWPNDASKNRLEERVRWFRGQDGTAYMAGANSDERRRRLQVVLEEIVRRRSSDAFEKEIWIVAGRSFSKQHFVRNMALGARATGETLQAFQLMDAWQGIAADQDVAIRYFVSP